MKGRILGLMLGFLFIGANVFAADGDLVVNGGLGVGTTVTTSVKAADNANPGQKFYWEVKAARADVEVLQVEQKDKKYHDKDEWKK